jgi:hypothetical protein
MCLGNYECFTLTDKLRIELILYEVVILRNFGRRSQASSLTYKPRFELFMANIDSKPPGFYSKHVRNLWISTADDPPAFERILSVCSGVENLVLFSNRRSINLPFIPFLEIRNAGSHLRRLTCKLETLFPPWSTMQNFQHPFFANLTHLHLYDEMEDWSTYVGFENLRSLSHLAFACCGPEELATVMPKLPVIEYVALGHYMTDQSVPSVRRRIPVEVYGIKVVLMDGLSINDWEGGATGRADFWDLVEREVSRRQAEMVRVHTTFMCNLVSNKLSSTIAGHLKPPSSFSLYCITSSVLDTSSPICSFVLLGGSFLLEVRSDQMQARKCS